MTQYTLTSYEPVSMKLPKPPVPPELVEHQIEKLMEPFSEYREIEEDRPCMVGDYIVVTTEDARMDGNPASHFNLKNSLYHLGAGEMPKAFDDAIIGMRSGETHGVKAMIKMPMGKVGGMSLLSMTVTIGRILYMVKPELTDELVCKEFAPATTVDEFRAGVAAQFNLPDMKKDDPKFPDLVLDEIAKRLVEEPSEEEAPLEEGTVIDPQTGEIVTMPDPDTVDQSSDDVLGDSPVNENLVDIVPQDGAEDSNAGNPTE